MRHCLPLITLVALLGNPCLGNAEDPTPKTSGFEAYQERARQTINKCTAYPEATQTVKAPVITVNVKICVFYSGDGLRPDNPKEPTAKELDRLTGGEVYFVAYLKDGANMKNIEIKSDILGSISRSEDVIFNYDLYQGSPSDRLEIDLGVFDDDGWPSDRADKLKVFQDSLGGALELFPAAAPGIPFIDPIIKLIVGTINMIDPDDSLISTKVFIEKQFDLGTKETTWKLYNPLISTDNGVIHFSINPQP